MQTPFEIITLKSGLKSLRSLEHGETFHPVTGPRVEARILHVEQQRLVERSRENKKFVIWDVGFGAAANALSAIEALQEMDNEIEIHSFDKTTAPIEFALENRLDLDYLATHEDLLERLLSEKSIRIGTHIQWNLHLGDFADQLRRADLPAPHAILYDPYSPTGNPEMWTLSHFTNLKNSLSPEVPCLLTNYTRSTAMRVALLLAGFFVGCGREVGEKAETTIASNRLELLERPLDLKWLKRIQHSTNSAPLRDPIYTKSPMSPNDYASLQGLKQFQQGIWLTAQDSGVLK